MIFVTVGTHEQQFNRLIECMDKFAESTDEDIVIQTGFSTYKPRHCNCQKWFSYKQMAEYVENARIIISHGGPSSFIAPLRIGKTPIVVPRQKKFGEHVNDHQVDFCRQVAEKMGTIFVVEDVITLPDIIEKYDDLIIGLNNGSKWNNSLFCRELEKIVNQMFEPKNKLR